MAVSPFLAQTKQRHCGSQSESEEAQVKRRRLISPRHAGFTKMNDTVTGNVKNEDLICLPDGTPIARLQPHWGRKGHPQ